MFIKKIALAALLAVTPALAFAGTAAAPAAKTEQAKPAAKATKAVKKTSSKATKSDKVMEGGEMKASQGRSVKPTKTPAKTTKTRRVSKVPASTPAVAK